MRQKLHRRAAWALVLVLGAGMLTPALAEAGNGRHRKGKRNHRSRPVHVEREVVHQHYRHDRYRDRGSNVGAFLGGVAVGTVLGHVADRCPPPPPPPRRVYVYDCTCGYQAHDYGSWSSHLVVTHHVRRADLDTCYPPHYGGYWRDW